MCKIYTFYVKINITCVPLKQSSERELIIVLGRNVSDIQCILIFAYENKENNES